MFLVSNSPSLQDMLSWQTSLVAHHLQFDPFNLVM